MFYRHAGVPVSLNTDDEGVSRGLLTMEFVKAAERYPLSYADLKYLARDYGQLRPEFAEVRGPIWQVTSAQEALLAKD